VLAFTFFTMLVGRLGDAAMGATSLTITLNMIKMVMGCVGGGYVLAGGGKTNGGTAP